MGSSLIGCLQDNQMILILILILLPVSQDTTSCGPHLDRPFPSMHEVSAVVFRVSVGPIPKGITHVVVVT